MVSIKCEKLNLNFYIILYNKNFDFIVGTETDIYTYKYKGSIKSIFV